jgi:hypothetical protein
MRCRSYRNYGEILRRNLQGNPLAVNNEPKRNIIKTYIIDYKNHTIKEVIDSDKKEDTISQSP